MEGYRKNVAMVVLNDKQDILICRRKGTENWQFPQGGIDENELIEDAMYRELYEEVGLKKEDVSIVGKTNREIKYDIPKTCLLYTSPSPRDLQGSRMPSSA